MDSDGAVTRTCGKVTQDRHGETASRANISLDVGSMGILPLCFLWEGHSETRNLEVSELGLQQMR
jgi:hypothetical protein